MADVGELFIEGLMAAEMQWFVCLWFVCLCVWLFVCVLFVVWLLIGWLLFACVDYCRT